MAYVTKVDLAKQTKLKAGDTAVFEGAIKIGDDFYITKYNNIINASGRTYLIKLTGDGKLTPVTIEELDLGGGGNTPGGGSLALKYRGLWGDTANLPYLMGDMVSHNGELYVLTITTLNQNTEPTPDMTVPWTLIAIAGYKGEDGVDGINGKDGKHYEYVFLATATMRIPTKPVEGTHYTSEQFQQDDFVPLLPNTWSDDEISVTPELPFIWRMARVKENNIWSNFGDPKLLGMPGGVGGDGGKGDTGDTYIRRYAKNGSTTTPPPLVNNVINPPNWDLVMPTVAVGEYLWMIEALITSANTLKTNWSNPIRQSPIDRGDDSDIAAPAMAFRGQWQSTGVYKGSQYVVDVVTHNGKGYIARVDATDIPIGQSPDLDVNGVYWNMFTEEADSFFADFLFAYSGFIKNLSADIITTGNEGEPRTIIGDVPTNELDPTTNEDIFYSHGIRQYYASGRVSMYMGAITNFKYFLENGTEATANGWALINFKDEDGSPPHSVQDNVQDKVTFVKTTPETWNPIPYVMIDSVVYNVGDNYPAFDWQHYNNLITYHYTPPYTSTVNGRPIRNSDSGDIDNRTENTYYKYLNGSILANQKYNGFHTTQEKLETNFIPDGWYSNKHLWNYFPGGNGRYGDPIGDILTARGWNINRTDIWYTWVYLIIKGKVIDSVTTIITPRRSN